jgi:hypothetical protein
MWAVLSGSVLVAAIVLMLCAGYVALFVDDAERRRDAYNVLKLMTIYTSSASGGAIGLLVMLRQLGLL